MSSGVVRQVFEREVRAWIAAQTIEPALVFVPSANVQAAPPLAPWMTLQYFTDASEALSYCAAGRVERGTVDAVIFTPAGSGDALAAALCDDLEHYITGRDLLADHIWIDGTVPAGEYSGGLPKSRHYGLITSIEYARYY